MKVRVSIESGSKTYGQCLHVQYECTQSMLTFIRTQGEGEDAEIVPIIEIIETQRKEGDNRAYISPEDDAVLTDFQKSAVTSVLPQLCDLLGQDVYFSGREENGAPFHKTCDVTLAEKAA